MSMPVNALCRKTSINSRLSRQGCGMAMDCCLVAFHWRSLSLLRKMVDEGDNGAEVAEMSYHHLELFCC